MGKNKFLVLFIILVFVSVAGGISVLSFQVSPKRSLPVYGETGNFLLVDDHSRDFDSLKLRNKVWIAAFFFTTCSGICPIMTKNLKALQDMLVAYKDLEFISISVNPEQDTPSALSAYADQYGIDTDRWHFLTGTREDITRIAVHGFKVGSVAEPIFHSPHFILVDRRFRVRGYYEGTQARDIQRLAKDIIELYPE